MSDAKYEAMLRRGPPVCVACGRTVEVTEDGYANHKCDERRESARKAAHTRHSEPTVRRRPLSQRLAEGFAMLGESE